MPRATTDPWRPGFRLARFELLNWGTFNARIWKIEPGGANALLTGDIGSGKSTLVDALTTLLVPPRRITYNKAAGADARERTLYSYVRGEYRSVTSELTGSTRAEALRGEDSYSVLLAVFADEAGGHGVSAAQVFWLREGERNPERMYVVAEEALSIAGQFTDFGGDVQALRKRLRTGRRISVHSTFEDYATRLRRLLGIPHPQALDLFYQTVSMKSVGNLTEFVRRHMLEADDTAGRVKGLIDNFENLNRAHDAVVRARDQIERLTPLVADGDRMDELEATTQRNRRAREALSAWTAGRRASLLAARMAELDIERAKLEGRVRQQTATLEQISVQRSEVRANIEARGGARLREIDVEVERRRTELARQRSDDEDYRRLCAALGVRPATNVEAFVATTTAATAKREAIEHARRELERAAIDKAVDFRRLSERDKEISDEVQSLRGRASNIPVDSMRIREALVAAVECDPEDLPFAGELLQVRPDERAWEGAIERLLHGFGLSLLVPERLYGAVSHYVDRTHLRGRLVFLRVRDEPVRSALRSTPPQSVARKLAIKPDTEFYGFLERELAEQFDHVCCDELDEFRRLPRALTRSGLVKAHDRRHEKDDRRALDDRSRYVLGWDNREKLRTLDAEQKELRRRLLAIDAERKRLRTETEQCDQRLRAADQLLALKDFARIDWRSQAAAIAGLEDQRRELESSNDVLRTLREQLAKLDADHAELDAARALAQQELGAVRGRSEQAATDRDAALAHAEQLSEAEREIIEPLLNEWRERVLAEQKWELRSLEAQERKIREALQSRIDADDKAVSRLREAIVDRMRQYAARYPAESAEMDARTEALPQYRRRLAILRDDDLPRFESRFKELLNKETINAMAAFQAHLQRRRSEIEEKVDTINRSLAAIEYDRAQGTFIELVGLASLDAEVRDFQTALRACLSGGGEGGELYTEQKFLEVKALVERLRGREGLADLDARWTAKVTDVRN